MVYRVSPEILYRFIPLRTAGVNALLKGTAFSRPVWSFDETRLLAAEVKFILVEVQHFAPHFLFVVSSRSGEICFSTTLPSAAEAAIVRHTSTARLKAVPLSKTSAPSARNGCATRKGCYVARPSSQESPALDVGERDSAWAMGRSEPASVEIRCAPGCSQVHLPPSELRGRAARSG